MITLYDRSGRAIMRLYDDWFVAYEEALCLQAVCESWRFKRPHQPI